MKKVIVLFLWLAVVSSAEAEQYCKKGSNCSYFSSWEVQALTLQNRLDMNEPFKRAIFPHTHNSYNNKGDGYTADVNHIVSISDQLKMGIRSLAFDVAPYPATLPYSKETSSIRLCHKVCSKSDLKLSKGLDIIRDFLRQDKYKNEVILLQIEVNLPTYNKGDYVKHVRKKIAEHLSDLVYRPSGGSCTDFNKTMLNKSKADILKAGKNVVILSEKACYKNEMNSWIFEGRLNKKIKQQKDAKPFKGFPDCTYDGKNITDFNAEIWRSYNDGTLLGKAFADAGKITVGEVKAMASCGINAIGPERLKKWMDQHKAQVWSWDENQPNDGKKGNCAMSQENGRFNDRDCSVKLNFACRDKNDHTRWKVTDTIGPWNNGSKACKDKFGSDYFFAVPHNGYQNNLLIQEKPKKDSSVWVNYSDLTKEGIWKEGK